MARGKEAQTRDPHRRFAAWLDTNTQDDPPRDLAVHAAVCVACQQRIAALDMLTAIDPALAGLPQARPLPVTGWVTTPGRAAVAAGGLAALMVVGIASWRLMQASNVEGVGPAVESPTQAVLGGTGAPETSAQASIRASAHPSGGEHSASEQPAQPSVVAPPPIIVQPTPPSVQPTPRPTVHPTATQRPTGTPVPTAIPTPPTPAPTPTPTPEPTPTASL